MPGEQRCAGGTSGQVDATLLQCIFALPTSAPSELHSHSSVCALLRLVQDFVATLQDESSKLINTDRLWPSLTDEDLAALAGAAAAATNDEATTWFPEFGAALLALGPGPGCTQARPGTLALNMVGLDRWEFRAHSSPAGIHHTAVCAGHQLLPCGSVAKAELAAMVQKVQRSIHTALERRKRGEKGFQRTPASIVSAVRAAAGSTAALAAGLTARGGFTDVGQHTGGDVPRDTCWPLVRSVLQVLLERAPGCIPASPPALLLRHALAHLELWLLRRQLCLLTPDTAGPTAVTNAMHMLTCAASKAAALAEEGHDVAEFEAACASARESLQAVAWERALQQGHGSELPPEGSPSLTGVTALPRGVLPARLTAGTDGGGGQDAARKRAELNLGAVTLLPPAASFMDMLGVLRGQKQWSSPGDDAQFQLVLHSVERELFERATAGFQPLSEEEVAALEAVVDTCRLTLQRFLATPAAAAAQAAGALLKAELLSRELLMVWVAYCLVHASACKQYDILRQYGVALSYKDLRHLVLPYRLAVDAAMAVAAYLQRLALPGRELFSLRDGAGKATSDMAQAFAATCPRLSKLWEQEKADAAARQAKHWEEVQRKQAEAVRLRQQLAKLKEEQLELKAKEATTRVWLFFLHMQPLFRSLARMSFLAQQMLLPRPFTPEVRDAVAVRGLGTSLVKHYNDARAQRKYLSQPSQKAASRDGTVQLWSAAGVVPSAKSYGPRHVDKLTSAADGVWHPDGLQPSMAWAGSGSGADGELGSPGFFNPFAPAVPASATELFYTAALPEHAKALQWALHTPESPPADRGNWALAWQDGRPSWLHKPAFLDFGRLRSFPLLQLPRLCAALHYRTLPLAQPAVHVLVRQLLHHVGSLTDDAPPQLLWRTGWADEPGGALPALCSELAALAERLAITPREHESVLVLGPMAAYLASFHPACLDTARRFADMTSDVAEELEAQLDLQSSDESLASRLTARQCRWRAVALLCYDCDGLDQDADAEAMNEALQLRAHGVLARRISFLVGTATRQPSLLTAALRAVMRGHDPQGLSDLSWAQRPGSAACFEAAEPGSGRLFAINLLNGTVLFDGCPPSRLSRAVTQHPLYSRTFGTWSFEVEGGGGAATGASTQRTLRRVRGRLYEFDQGTGGRELLVTEVDERGLRLELLDAGPDGGCGEWGKELPPRLRQLHSHWLCSPIGGAASGGASVAYDIRRVPPHLRSFHWSDLLLEHHSAQLTDQLVSLNGCALKDTVLGKFERPEFIHCFQPAARQPSGPAAPAHTATEASIPLKRTRSGTPVGKAQRGAPGGGSMAAEPPPTWRLLFELPRFGYEFELRSGGELASRDRAGYRLHRRQLLTDGDLERPQEASYTLPEFGQYLVLERQPSPQQQPSSSSQGSAQLVLVPAGPVVRQADRVSVTTSSYCDAHLRAHCYELHGRFGHLCASSIPARLQLAALYAATGTLLPEPASQATGSQTAMTLLRQCWGTRPLSRAELQHLRSVARLGGHLAPGLTLLAAELEEAASQLGHLHSSPQQPGAGGSGDAVGGGKGGVELLDAQTVYEQDIVRSGRGGGAGLNPRLRLTPSDEERALGLPRGPPEEPEWRRRGLFQAVELAEAFPVPEDYVEGRETLLALLVKPAPGADQPSSPPPYPLAPAPGAQCTPLAAEMDGELKASWEAHRTLQPPEQMVWSHPASAAFIPKAQAQVTDRRAAAEAYLLRHLSHVPSGTGCHGAAFRLLRMSGSAPTAGLLDLAAAAWCRESLRFFNPFLSEAAEQALHDGVLTWLALCVLEDRLGRLAALAAAGQEHWVQLVQELLVRRTWEVREHPQWLVFEAEGRLQIRPQQYAVAAHLMDPANDGAIAQLNMGEGKTRVILPMLALHWADGSRVVRLNFLSRLLDDSYAHLHATLTASILGRKLFVLPFHRDVEPTEGRVQAMVSAMRHCQQDGGLLLVAPEHRLSLLLKRTELALRAERCEAGAQQALLTCCSALDELAGLPYMDVLDESDELLHHRYQLAYAWGAASGLQAVAEQSEAVQALLAALTRLAATGRLPLPEAAFVLEPPSAAPLPPPGAYCGLRLLPGEALSGAVLRALREALAEEVAVRPPLKLRWLKRHPLRDRVLGCVLDESRPETEYLGPDAVGTAEGQLTSDRMSQVLALRGLLGCGLLEQGLQKRHRVEYGVDRNSNSTARGRTRMAVPFHAAHVPSERSEFAQPDVALLLTHLSYYYDGLSMSQLEAALAKLLDMEVAARRYYYEKLWLPLAVGRIKQEHLGLLNSADKLDPSNNPTQLQHLHAYFSHNTALVDFWLAYCVLPTETRQFPQCLCTSAWHLAGCGGGSSDGGGGGVVGFSGTNDNHRLLPLRVHKAEPDEPSLAATNGRMLHAILEHTLGFTTLPAEGTGGLPAWQALLDEALALAAALPQQHDRGGGSSGSGGGGGPELRAIIDCGALLAGASNRSAAAYLLRRLDPARFKGVTCFDERERAWVVADALGRRWPLHASPIPAADTFAIFDDARCRGADLKLRLNAVGLLTLGPGATKDKVMQAAGRLRQLGRGQRLWMAAAPDVTAKIQSAAAAHAASPAFTRAAGTSAAGVRQAPAGPTEAAPTPSPARSPGPGIGPAAVLCWVMDNTVAATLAGVPAWADQGLAFAASGGVSGPEDELLELADLYGGSKALVPVAQAVAALAAKHSKTAASAGGKPGRGQGVRRCVEMAERIVQLAGVHGQGHAVVAGGRADEECERELEQEEEEEEEVERQVARVNPRKETDWNLAAAVTAVAAGGGAALTATALAKAAGVKPFDLPPAMELLAPRALQQVAWSAKVLATENFLVASAAPRPSCLNDYLRPVECMVLFPGSGEALLLSEREADQLLGAVWQRRRRAKPCSSGAGVGGNSGMVPAPLLVSLSFLRDAWGSDSVPRLALSPASGSIPPAGEFPGTRALQGRAGAAHGPLDARALVSMQLFNGETSYAGGAVRQELRGLMLGRREVAQALAEMRGKGAALPKSDLERAVEGADEEG
ncbi:hypothetical protein HYH03_005361 [Edaphochlamys debaryana]|uniref:ubiquitinyl hydrolase 1 n=1 Tax=Edaphochlamys debaryana TaxID=47281 RepID=A0A835Y855_9CHLO|nr:hypothetical protein HYH03_005361 [Edaphochlamys debaryana]|eukprot:KAG2496538.1 hypothetical protein HYH03_005361 [Edaphochlamys debaryana]